VPARVLDDAGRDGPAFREGLVVAQVLVPGTQALVPTVPGAVVEINPEELAGFRPSYRMLSLWLTGRGHPVDALYRDVFGWAGLPVE